MNPGQLGQRVRLERAEFSQSETGEVTPTWVSLGDVWGSVEPQAGREFVAGGAMQSELTTKIRIRWKAGIQSADRVTYGGRSYNIQSVIDYRSARRELVLMCRG